MFNRLARFIATSFLTGYFPFAPGTVGSAVGLLLFLLIPGLREIYLLIFIILGFFTGVWSAGLVEKTDGHDASIITIDEMVGMWLSLLFLPSDLSVFWYIGAFLLFRIFDIFKPFPAYQSQNLSSGWGVMMDDIIAGIYTNFSLRIILLVFVR